MAYTDLARCSGGKQLHPLGFNGQQLRHLMIDGEPWFVATDACRMLTLKSHASNGSYTGHLRRLDISERCIVTASELPTTPSGRDGRKQSVVSESGFYKLILRCDKEVAVPFQNWMKQEVLPSTFGGPAAHYALEPPSSPVQSLQVLPTTHVAKSHRPDSTGLTAEQVQNSDPHCWLRAVYD